MTESKTAGVMVGAAEVRRARIRDMVTAALIAALMCATSMIAIPNPLLPTVPVTPQVFFVVLAALMLPPGWAAASMLVYVALGAAGLPVFAGGTSGMGAIAGPTGGFLVGFVLGALLGSVARSAVVRVLDRPVVADIAAAVAAIASIYAVGVTQLSIVSGTPVWATFVAMTSFVVVDVAKAAAAIGVAAAVRKATGR